MKLKENLEITEEVLDAFKNLFNYSFEDVNSYEELTFSEKEIISEELFNKIIDRTNYQEIIDNLKLERISITSVEDKDDYTIISIKGGLNGNGGLAFYLNQVSIIIVTLLQYCKDVWLIDWENDCPDDVWYLRLGIRK